MISVLLGRGFFLGRDQGAGRRDAILSVVDGELGFRDGRSFALALTPIGRDALDRLRSVRDLHQLGCVRLADADLVLEQLFPLGPKRANGSVVIARARALVYLAHRY